MKQDWLDDVIGEDVIAACEAAGACEPGLTWAREQPRTFRQLREYKIFWMAWIAENIKMQEILVALAGYPYAYLRQAVAANPSTPSEILAALADDEERNVRGAAAARLASTNA